MNESTQTLVRVTPDEVDALIEKARTEKWQKLALVGPNSYIPESPKEWPAE